MLMAKKMFLLRDLHMYIDVDVGLKKMGGEVWGGGERGLSQGTEWNQNRIFRSTYSYNVFPVSEYREIIPTNEDAT